MSCPPSPLFPPPTGPGPGPLRACEAWDTVSLLRSSHLRCCLSSVVYTRELVNCCLHLEGQSLIQTLEWSVLRGGGLLRSVNIRGRRKEGMLGEVKAGTTHSFTHSPNA